MRTCLLVSESSQWHHWRIATGTLEWVANPSLHRTFTNCTPPTFGGAFQGLSLILVLQSITSQCYIFYIYSRPITPCW